jgi:hypothetical protein
MKIIVFFILKIVYGFWTQKNLGKRFLILGTILKWLDILNLIKHMN